LHHPRQRSSRRDHSTTPTVTSATYRKNTPKMSPIVVTIGDIFGVFFLYVALVSVGVVL